MLFRRFYCILFLLLVAVLFQKTNAQDSIAKPAISNILRNDLTVSYAVKMHSSKSNTGIGETYDGGIKTIFISGTRARIRLVSLMRMQSIFVLKPAEAMPAAVVTKESGKKKYKYYLTKDEWKKYNRKYDSVTCELTNDSTVILNYPCRKAIIHLKDGRNINVFYTDSIRSNVLSIAEPAFYCIPGLVLQYEYEHKKGSVIYTATSISEADIDKGVFRVPVKGFVLRRFSLAPTSSKSDKEIADQSEFEN